MDVTIIELARQSGQPAYLPRSYYYEASPSGVYPEFGTRFRAREEDAHLTRIASAVANWRGSAPPRDGGGVPL